MPNNRPDSDDYQSINWTDEFDKQLYLYRPIQDMMQEEFPTINSALSFSPKTLTRIYALATRHLSTCPMERLEDELTALRQYLSSLLPEAHAPHDNFHRDFARLAYFIYIEQSSETVSAGSLWGALDILSRSEARYLEVVEILLTHKINLLTGRICTNLKELNEELNSYEQLAGRLRDGEPQLPDTTQSSFSELLLKWLKNIWDFFKSFLSQRDASHYAGDDEVILRLLKFVRQSNEACLDFDDGFNMLSAWYEGRAKQREPKTNYWQEVLNQEMERAEASSSLWKKVSSWHKAPDYKALTNSLSRELSSIEQWAANMFKSIWVNSSSDPTTLATLLQRHLDVYQRMQIQLQSWQERALSIRMHKEKSLRGINRVSSFVSGDYLTRLKVIDDELLVLYRKMKQISHHNFDTAQKYAHDAYVEILKEANQALLKIEEPIEKLERIYWVEHTCYAFRDTEGHVAYELEARNKLVKEACFYQYDLARVYTISDKVMDNYLESDKAVKQLAVFAATDKHMTEREKPLRCIFEYCIRRINTLRDDAENIDELWQLGQWRLHSEDAEVEANIETIRMARRVTCVEKPTSQLGLSVLLMLQEHRLLIDKGESLCREKTKSTSILNSFFTSSDPENRASFEWMKEHYDEIDASVRLREAEIEHRAQMQAAAEQKGENERTQRLASEQKTTASEQKTKASEQKAEEERTQRLVVEQKMAQQAAQIAALIAQLAAATGQQPPLHHASPIHVASAPDIDSQPSVQSTQGFSQ